MGLAPDFKFTQQNLTELNADGNPQRGREGEDLTEEKPKPKPTSNEDENPNW